MSFYRIGVDVGGTNTDAAILDVMAPETESRGVLASYKTSTTSDITSGIATALEAVLEASNVDLDRVIAVTIGTTHFINALIEVDADQLSRVAVVRLCGPFTAQIPPFSDFPIRLRSILDGGSFFLNGGMEYNGDEIQPLDAEQIRQATHEIVDTGVQSVAIVGVFSPIDHAGLQEEVCKRIMLEVNPDLEITISRDVGPCGLLERENATILNSAVLRVARTVITGFRRAMATIGLQCPLYLSRNDGTMIGVDAASGLPITTFASGPTNSMIGAAFLAGHDRYNAPVSTEASAAEPNGDTPEPQVIVMDIGGTTTDVCALLPSGFPRQAPGFTEVAGVRTAFSMPEVYCVGLGGGSVVTVDEGSGQVSLGPASVGHFLTQDALVFGGSKMTSTDIIVGLGQANLGNPLLVADIPQTVIQAARKSIKKTLEDTVEKMRVSAAPVHLLLVGGGALLVTEDLDGVEKCIRPNHLGAANAVGAAVSEISGEVDVIETLQGRNEKEIVAAACEEAVKVAIERGAAADGVRIVDIIKTPLQYVNNGAIRIQIRAVGKLAVPNQVPAKVIAPVDTGPAGEPDAKLKTRIESLVPEPPSESEDVDITTYRPEVTKGVWYVSSVDIDFISTGCGVLGTGGGGSTHHEALLCREVLRSGGNGRMRIVSPESLKDDDLVGFGSWYGAPSVGTERIANGNEISLGLDALLTVLGGKKLDALLVDEIGGGNGLSAFPTGVQYDIPVVDGDTMGRAYPTMFHATTSVYGHSLTPCALTDCRGNVSILMSADSPLRVEKILRSTAVELGLGCAVCANPLSGKAIKSHAVPRTISLAWYIGRAIHMARKEKSSYMTALTQICNATSLFTGKIIDVQRHVKDGYTTGSVLLEPLSLEGQDGADYEVLASRDCEKFMIIPFQNEYLYAALTDGTGPTAEKVVCTVPELISIMGQDGEAIGSQDLRYGMHVNVISLPAHPLWKTPEALRVGGPEGFGLDIPFVGIGKQPENPSVIEEYGR